MTVEEATMPSGCQIVQLLDVGREGKLMLVVPAAPAKTMLNCKKHRAERLEHRCLIVPTKKQVCQLLTRN